MDALDGFIGKGLVEVSIKGRKLKIAVDFGEIRIPRVYVKENEVKGIEEDHECIIMTRGDYVVIIPRYLAEKEFVCSCNQEDKSRLEQWFNKNSREVVAKLLAD